MKKLKIVISTLILLLAVITPFFRSAYAETVPGTYYLDLGQDLTVGTFKFKSGTGKISNIEFYSSGDVKLFGYANTLPAQFGVNISSGPIVIRYIKFTLDANSTITEASVFPDLNSKGMETKFSTFTISAPSITPAPTVEPTPTPSPTPEQSTGDNAILSITLVNGTVKEFDLPMSEVNSFLTWYDTATDSGKYGIDKHDNNKGPFTKRTEYVIHDKILTFEVSEYTAK